MPSVRKKAPLSPRSGVVRHTDTVVSLEHALTRVPQTERVQVMLEHAQTGESQRTTWNRVAVCIALRKGSETYGIFTTYGRAKNEGFGIVTRHVALPHMFVFIDTRPATRPATSETS